MKYRVVLEPRACEDWERHLDAGNKILVKKIARLLDELERHPRTGCGKPERLRYSAAEVWSRRIDDRHRMLYAIEEDKVMVFVIALWGHYDDR